MELKKFLDKNKKTIIIVVAIIVIAFLLNKYWWKIERIFKPRVSNDSPDNLTDARKLQIQGIANAMFQDIEHTSFWTGHDYTSYQQALTLYDNEIKYLADYFKNYSAAGAYSLKAGIDSQIYTWGDSPAKLSNILAEVGKF